MAERRTSFVQQLATGEARLDEFGAVVASWLNGPRTSPLHVVLGMNADELDVVARYPDTLRWIVYARRFDVPLTLSDVATPARAHAQSMRLAAAVADARDVADIDAWSASLRGGVVSREQVDA